MLKMSGLIFLEWLVSITIISWLSILSYATYNYLYQYYYCQYNIKILFSSLNYARTQALLRHIPITICPIASNDNNLTNCDNNWNYPLAIIADISQQHNLVQPNYLLTKIPLKLHGGYFLWKNFPNHSYLQFSNYGFTNSQNGSFIYCPKNKIRYKKIIQAIVINQAGRIRIVKTLNHHLNCI